MFTAIVNTVCSLPGFHVPTGQERQMWEDHAAFFASFFTAFAMGIGMFNERTFTLLDDSDLSDQCNKIFNRQVL